MEGYVNARPDPELLTIEELDRHPAPWPGPHHLPRGKGLTDAYRLPLPLPQNFRRAYDAHNPPRFLSKNWRGYCEQKDDTAKNAAKEKRI